MATVGIRLRPSERMQYVDDAGHDLKISDRVAVELGESDSEAAEAAEAAEAVVAVASGQVIFSELRETQGVVAAVVSRARP